MGAELQSLYFIIKFDPSAPSQPPLVTGKDSGAWRPLWFSISASLVYTQSKQRKQFVNKQRRRVLKECGATPTMAWKAGELGSQDQGWSCRQILTTELDCWGPNSCYHQPRTTQPVWLLLVCLTLLILLPPGMGCCPLSLPLRVDLSLSSFSASLAAVSKSWMGPSEQMGLGYVSCFTFKTGWESKSQDFSFCLLARCLRWREFPKHRKKFNLLGHR